MDSLPNNTNWFFVTFIGSLDIGLGVPCPQICRAITLTEAFWIGSGLCLSVSFVTDILLILALPL